MAVYSTPERIALTLLQLADSIGTPGADRSVRLRPLTHQTIAEYVCTSREIVTFHMNRLRTNGIVRYSRFIDIRADALTQVLKERGETSATCRKPAHMSTEAGPPPCCS
jgi:CRP-like cAMP-binding protein